MSGEDGARAAVLGRIRAALADVAPGGGEAGEAAAADVPRRYAQAHVAEQPEALRDLLAENLADYRAIVHRVDGAADVPGRVAALLAETGVRTLAVPEGLPAAWTAGLDAAGVRVVADAAELTPDRLDAVDCVLTGCAVAIAETGTIVLDAGAGQGRRRLTLVPDHHVCVVRAEQVVASVPRALPRLDPARPQTWISGPSATSDIELDRVEGVHGPRRLDVLVVAE